MSDVIVKSNRYTVDPLYQWDINQVLTIHGLSLPSVPEIHFTNSGMDRAIVKQATMDDAGVITADVPNSLLQKPYKITAYVCIYEGDTFKSLYTIEIPVKARKKPGDYFLENDEEIYSFNALENLINNTVVSLRNMTNETTKNFDDKFNQFNNNFTGNYNSLVNALNSHTKQNNPHNLTLELLGGAPAGYGLGGANAPIVRRLTVDDDINTIVENGWYDWADSPKNAPLSYCVMRTWSGLGEYFVQEIITGNIYHDNVIMRRYTKSGATGWQPWEYVNPPMIIGEEYRTTERYNNSPIYTMLVDCGVTSTRTSVNAPSGATRIVNYKAWCNHKLLPLADYINQTSYFAYTSVDVDGLSVWYNADAKSDGFGSGKEHWFVQFWYTK